MIGAPCHLTHHPLFLSPYPPPSFPPSLQEVALALKNSRTVAMDVSISILRRALQSSLAKRFLLDGFPRLVSDGFPGVHDQAAELSSLGRVLGAISLDAQLEQRRQRIAGTPSVGDEAALLKSVDTYNREKAPVFRYFEKLGKAMTVSSGHLSPFVASNQP